MAPFHKPGPPIRNCVVSLHFLPNGRSLCGLPATGALNLVISLEDAITILNKWKKESANILVVAESPFQHSIRGIEGRGVRWHIGQHVRVSQVSFSGDEKICNPVIIDLQGSAGNFLSLSIFHSRIVYGEPREASEENKDEAIATTVSALSIFLSEAAFHFYELRQP